MSDLRCLGSLLRLSTTYLLNWLKRSNLNHWIDFISALAPLEFAAFAKEPPSHTHSLNFPLCSNDASLRQSFERLEILQRAALLLLDFHLSSQDRFPTTLQEINPADSMLQPLSKPLFQPADRVKPRNSAVGIFPVAVEHAESPSWSLVPG